jgi:hypothetical protein
VGTRLDKDGTNQVWSLEGGGPSGLIRQGWTSKTLKPGDEVQLTVALRGGAPGDSWNVNKIKFKNGEPISRSRGFAVRTDACAAR